MGRQVKDGSRTLRRQGTKSGSRKHCQSRTKHAARKAAQTLIGKPRGVRITHIRINWSVPVDVTV